MTKKEYNRHFDEIIQAFRGGFLSENDARIEIQNLSAHYVTMMAKEIHGTTQAERE